MKLIEYIKKIMSMLAIMLIPLFYFNCAKSGGGSSDPSGVSLAPQVTMKETVNCMSAGLGLSYHMDTYSDGTKKISCDWNGTGGMASVSGYDCPTEQPMTMHYYYPVEIQRMIGGQMVTVGSYNQVVTLNFTYGSQECHTTDY